jgi:hypothetical protein
VCCCKVLIKLRKRCKKLKILLLGLMNRAIPDVPGKNLKLAVVSVFMTKMSTCKLGTDSADFCAQKLRS